MATTTSPENGDNNADSGSSKADLKSAASLLLKGGTLVKEPCARCRGVQVKLKDRVRCINCGNETLLAPEPQQKQHPLAHEEKPQVLEKKESLQRQEKKPDLASSVTIIEEKIILLAQEIKDERDLGIQKQKAELLETYVRILEKITSLSC